MNKNQKLVSYYEELKKHNTVQLVCIFTFFLIIPIFVAIIYNIIASIKIMTNQYDVRELDNEKIVWGILSLLLLGIIATFVFQIKIKNHLNDESNNVVSNSKEETNDKDDSQKQLESSTKEEDSKE